MSMKLRASSLAFVLGTSALASTIVFTPRPAWAQKVRSDEIALAIGETRTLPATGVKDYAKGSDVIEVVATASNMIITGRKEGTTTLSLFMTNGSETKYEVAVAKRNVAAVEREVQELIKDISGPRTRRIGAKVFIDGSVATPAEKARVDQIANVYGDQVQSIVTIGRFEERKLLVRLDFFFVEYERTSSYNVGLGWPATIGGTQNGAAQDVFGNSYTFDLVTRTTTQAQATIVNQPLPRLDILQQHGWVKIAKQASVITANGNEAKLQSGGEQNFLIAGVGAAQIQAVKFGSETTVLPRYDSNTRDVELKLTADFSDLTAPQTNGGPPGRTTTHLETQVVLKLGQALILGGIKTANQSHNVSGLPGLSEIPVLGLLFGTHTNKKDETEGAIFIVPSVVDTVPKSALELINNAMTTYKEYSGEIEYVEAYPKTPPSAK